jgi:dihydroorotate dehydrogenase electron transfer subunit
MPQPLLTRLAVTQLTPLGGDRTVFYLLRLTLPPWQDWRPGQFIMIRPAENGSSRLWARPFAICGVDDDGLTIFFQARGRATRAMTGLTPGSPLDAWGPLGNALAVEMSAPTLLLAGGIGIAPFIGYVRSHPHPEKLSMEFGHRAPLASYPFEGIAERITARAHREREERDRQDFLRLLEERVQNLPADGLILACGPTPFLEFAQRLALRRGIRAQLCLETRMACGIGACLGCVVKAALPPEKGQKSPDRRDSSGSDDHAGFRHLQTCAHGPNFWANSVRLR